MYKRKRKMKVLVLWRGPSPYRVDFFNELGKLCDLTVLFERTPEQIPDKERNWFHENYDHFNAIYLKSQKLGKTVISFKQFKYLWHHKEYDYIIVGMYSTWIQMMSIIFMKLLGIPYILNSDGGFIKKESIFLRLMKHFFISNASAYLASSSGTAKYLQYYGASKKIFVYPFTTSFKKDVYKQISLNEKINCRKSIGAKENVIVLFSGQFIYRKGIDVLLNAARHIDGKCGIYIVGGKATQEYLSIVSRYSLKNIHFVDFKTPKELAVFYEAADIYVLPTREDIWGLVINEAMSYGLPVITTDKCLAGLELIENGKNGYTVPVDNPTELAKYINILADDIKLRESISNNNKLKIQEYNLENMAKSHFTFLKNINNL